MELIRHLQEWHRADIYQELLNAVDQAKATAITVNSILRVMEYGTFVDKPGHYQPYRDLIAAVSVPLFVEGMTYLFAHDPSRTQESVQTVDECFGESPFPRYFVALAYSILHRQLIPQAQWDDCSSAQKLALGEAVWHNIVDTGNLQAYPSAMVIVLTDQFSVPALLERSLPLIADDRATANTVGDILLSQLTQEDDSLVNDVIKGLQQLIDAETDPVKQQKYQDYLKTRSRSILHSIADLIQPWKQ